jgi:hypothetical protein
VQPARGDLPDSSGIQARGLYQKLLGTGRLALVADD